MQLWLAVILKGSSSIDPFLSISALEGHYEITISLNNHMGHFKISYETA
jgi:hypothetical protein